MHIDTPVLHKAQPYHGVVPLLTEDAYAAHCAGWRCYLRLGSWETAVAVQPKIMKGLEARVAAGTFTFVDPERYYLSDPMYRVVHTGSTMLLDEIRQLCTVVTFETPFSVPFSSGDLSTYQELLDKGYGPHTEKFMQIFAQAMSAQVHNARGQIIAGRPHLLSH